jgi:putative hydrolase of HD superfamily
MRKFGQILLRDICIKDLENYYDLYHPSRKFHQFNGPYYEKSTEEELRDYVEELRTKLDDGQSGAFGNKKLIVDELSGDLIGQVNWYWKSVETLWMEIGIVIFNEQYWGKGMGYKGLSLWIDELFESRPELVRLGLSTWSGNLRMMALAEKLGFTKEAVYRKARIVNGEYFDSISYGILREEWNVDTLST